MFGLTFAPVMLAAQFALGQTEHGFEPVKNKVFDEERKVVSDFWILDFTFRKPRFAPVNVPGEGRKLVWYMVYKISNKTGEPRQFIPRFTLITNPTNAEGKVVLADGTVGQQLTSKTFNDVILTNAEAAVTAREEPARQLFNSVTITKPLNPTPKDGAPIERYGVVFWKDVPMGDTKTFHIDVTGLSNGYQRLEDPKDRKSEKVLRKTLELRFTKPGDDYSPNDREVRFEGFDWKYK
jgi:hypothetical protein